MMTDWLAVLAPGLVTTLQLLAFSFVGAVLLSVLIAMGRTSGNRVVRFLTTVYVDIMRSVPVLVLLTLFYFVYGSLWSTLGIKPFWVAVIVLAANDAAYLGEVYRAALQSISQKQWDAAASLGISRRRTFLKIIVPQAVIPAVPATVNTILYLIKAGSLASLVAVPELTAAAAQLVAITFKPMEVYLTLTGLYLALIIPIAYLCRWGERAIGRTYGVLPAGSPRSILGFGTKRKVEINV